MKDPIQVALVEDNAEFSEVISLALKDRSDIELVSQFGSSEIALRSLQEQRGRDPDIVLMDIRLPGMDGLDSLPWFREQLPRTKIIMLTQSDKESDVLQAIAHGASGYLLKSATVRQIVDGIQTVMDGGATLDPSVARFVLNSLQSRLPQSEELQRALTDRELEVLKLIAEGLVKKEIASRLDIGYTTVDSHVSKIYEKLQVRNAAGAVHQGHRRGLFLPQKN